MTFPTLRTIYFGNTVEQYLICLGILLLGLVLKRFVSKVLNTLAFRLVKGYVKEDGVTEAEFQALLVKPVERLLLVITLYFAFNVLNYPLDPSDITRRTPWPKKLAFNVWQVFVIWSSASVVLRLVDFTAMVYLRRADKQVTRMDNQLILFGKDFLKVLIWFGAMMVLLSIVFHYDVRAFIAGLGIGGLALAFAAKESIENLLASFTIFLDRPFTMGELVTVGDVTGTIEKIGFRSTRIRTAEKSFVTMPNKMMIDRPLNNLSRRPARRVRFDLFLTYDTTTEQLRRITDQATALIREQPHVMPDDVLVRFNALTAAAKVVYVEYFIATESYTEYLDVVQTVNYALTRIVSQSGGGFANANGFELAGREGTTTTDQPPRLSSSDPANTGPVGR